MSYYTDVIKKYATFSGRARRKEYWMFVLINFIIALVISFIEKALGLTFEAGGSEVGIISLIYSLFILIPSLALTVRRLHDTDKSGWWILIELVPLVGSIVLFVFTVLAGNIGPNKYGDDPKQVRVI